MKTHLRTIDVVGPPSERLLRAAAAFCLAVRGRRRAQPAPARDRDAARAIARSHAALVLITGPSGGGKSSLLGQIARASRPLRRRVLPLPALPARGAPVIDLVRGPLGEALATLARAGLADATLIGHAPARLSEGERFRLRLALAFAACRGARTPVTLLIDEFASTLDRTTARCLCVALRRWLGREADAGRDVRVILATAHHDVADWLAPDMVAVVPLGGGPVEFTRRPPVLGFSLPQRRGAAA